jgi:hypothetical protein
MNFKNNIIIDDILSSFKNDLKSDFNVYKNHVYRIYYYALYMDDNKENSEKYAIAAAFHDIGIWTHSFDYLAPSIQLAKNYLNKKNQKTWYSEIALMIDNHHKISVYDGEFQKTVEVFRIADWIDVLPYYSKKAKTNAIDKTRYKTIQKIYPIKGFHWFLIKQSLKWFVKHPLNPLPMFKR